MQQLRPPARRSDKSPQRGPFTGADKLVFIALLIPATHVSTSPDVTTGGGSLQPGAVSPCPSQAR